MADEKIMLALQQPPLASGHREETEAIVAQLETIANFRDITHNIVCLKVSQCYCLPDPTQRLIQQLGCLSCVLFGTSQSGCIYRSATPSQASLEDTNCLVEEYQIKVIANLVSCLALS